METSVFDFWLRGFMPVFVQSIFKKRLAYFEMRNCTFYNSGNNQHDGGLKLYSVTMGLLETLNCSSNSGNGIILDTCQDVIIRQSTINNNDRSGIKLSKGWALKNSSVSSL